MKQVSPGHAFLVAVLALMSLAACQSGETPDDSTSAASQTGVSITQENSGTGGQADAATTAYIQCLVEHGIDATVGPNGEVMMPMPDNGVVSANDTPSAEVAAAEQVCQETVPDYAPVDLNQK
ncbi:MAG: hypothetical protein LBV00_11490 [Propionibacteriaceae bacterium]|jgi:hypothetical protein|nr:hypothetical protein [Propionibacteriaceae bacterium]